MEPLHDVARIGHAELLTPKPDESLRFFVDVLGLEEEARDGQSVYLRGWGDYLRYSLKLTEAPRAGLRHLPPPPLAPPPPALPVPRPRRARLRALPRGRALHGARAPSTVVEEPAAALRRSRRLCQAAR